MAEASLVDRLDALLPQTQCRRCGYAACRPYAEALANGQADVNRCPPGGEAGISRLASVLGRKTLPLDAGCGNERAVEIVAHIVEADCIGCTKCIQACPVDAIVGGMNRMHTVLESICNGCELCVPVCPVDCIELNDSPGLPPPFARAGEFRQRYLAHLDREERRARQEQLRRQRHKGGASDPVAAALARASGRAS